MFSGSQETSYKTKRKIMDMNETNKHSFLNTSTFIFSKKRN